MDNWPSVDKMAVHITFGVEPKEHIYRGGRNRSDGIGQCRIQENRHFRVGADHHPSKYPVPQEPP